MPPLAATVSGLADVSQQSRRRHRGDRPLCPADDRIPNSVLSCHCAPRTTTLGVVWRDGKSDRGVDLAPGHRGVPVGPRAAISHSRSRHLVWSSLLAADPCNGHSGPSDCTPIALAERLRCIMHLMSWLSYDPRRKPWSLHDFCADTGILSVYSGRAARTRFLHSDKEHQTSLFDVTKK